MSGTSDPLRDRQLAAQPRLRARNATPLADAVDGWLKSEEARRLRRFQRVAAALKQSLDARALARVRPLTFRSGVLTLEVTDGPLLAELRQHRQHALLDALAKAGTGVSRIQWRLARR
jgi:predicted nucleic acid-binding Zn ribbon protein